MVLLFLFYINVCIMAIQVSTQSEYPLMYLVTLNRARTSNIKTLTNETEDSCGRFAFTRQYDLKSFKKDMSLLQMRLSLNVRHLFINQLLTNFTKEVKSKIRPVTTEAYW
ncbi:hypothetical protein KSF78_0009472 [Schistosoma japonicum]|nr:hypothetical protein KSF78_0009472 [Schistosoma japonicum]